MVRALEKLPNGGRAPLAEIPVLGTGEFRETLLSAGRAGRLVAFFGMPEGDEVKLVAVLSREGDPALSITSTRVGASYSALTPDLPQAHLFEREIAEQWGVRPEGHPWLKPVRFHRSYRPGKDAWNRPASSAILPGVLEYFEVEGEEVHEVGVGPVHAGVIEPGHFRFQCHGERVIHLEIALGYQHRGIERSLEGGPDKRTVHTIEAVAGDTVVGHALAYAQAMEALSGCTLPPCVHALRAVALELERLANHAGDLGALAGDVGYLPTAAFCGRIRGDFLNLTLLACGNRMGLGWIRPGGSGTELESGQAARIADGLERAVAELERSFNLIRANSTVRSRFEDAGPLTREICEDLGVVGPAARACSVQRDVRREFPLGRYADVAIPVATWFSGDVFGRARVRWLECANSTEYARAALREWDGGERQNAVGALAPDSLAVSLVEGWRGEICHVAVTDGSGRLRRYKIVDPSFHNWAALAMVMRDQPISDFPLCNKSFNLSYSGHDL